MEIAGIRDTKTIVTGVEMFRKLLDQGWRATTPACAARYRAMTWSVGRWCASRARSSAHGVRGRVYVLSKDEGGRHTPFFKGYRPQFYFRDRRDGACQLPEGVEMVMPGDNGRWW